MTWVWAPDPATAERVRQITDGASGAAPRRTGAASDPTLTSAWVAMEACQALAAAGFTFEWHESVHPLNRAYAGWEITLPGMPG